MGIITRVHVLTTSWLVGAICKASMLACILACGELQKTVGYGRANFRSQLSMFWKTLHAYTFAQRYRDGRALKTRHRLHGQCMCAQEQK